jgi:hypothetical protein
LPRPSPLLKQLDSLFIVTSRFSVGFDCGALGNVFVLAARARAGTGVLMGVSVREVCPGLQALGYGVGHGSESMHAAEGVELVIALVPRARLRYSLLSSLFGKFSFPWGSRDFVPEPLALPPGNVAVLPAGANVYM